MYCFQMILCKYCNSGKGDNADNFSEFETEGQTT